jgi:polygalacturonase
LEDKAIIKFSFDFDDYLPMVRIRWEGTELNNFSPLIYANGQQNIGIEGRGILDGHERIGGIITKSWSKNIIEMVRENPNIKNNSQTLII